MKCFVSLIIFASFCGVCLVAVGGVETKVLDIRPRITSHGGQVTMADVALYPEQLSEKERAMVIMEDVVLEHVGQLTLRRLAYLLQAHEELHHLRLRGPQQLQIIRRAGIQDVAAVRQAILDWLEERPPWSGWELDLQFQPSDELLIAQAGVFDDVVVVSLDNQQPLGRLRVQVRFDRENLAGQPVQLSPRLLRLTRHVVLTRHLPAGHVIATEDVSVQESWSDRDQPDRVGETAACLGFELNRRLDAGTPLATADLLEPRCAQKGDQIWVECSKGALTVRLIAIAGEHGRRGDQIRLHNIATGKLFRAVLSGPRAAVLQLGALP